MIEGETLGSKRKEIGYGLGTSSNSFPSSVIEVSEAKHSTIRGVRLLFQIGGT